MGCENGENAEEAAGSVPGTSRSPRGTSNSSTTSRSVSGGLDSSISTDPSVGSGKSSPEKGDSSVYWSKEAIYDSYSSEDDQLEFITFSPTRRSLDINGSASSSLILPLTAQSISVIDSPARRPPHSLSSPLIAALGSPPLSAAPLTLHSESPPMLHPDSAITGANLRNIIIGIDFTKSNERTVLLEGNYPFNNWSLHTTGGALNQYEKVISIIGKNSAPLFEDNSIPCFGFGDETTHDTEVFSFHSDHSPCQGFDEVLSCYRKIVPNLRFSGPTSYTPVIEAAIDIVEKSGGQYHVLLIISGRQVARSGNKNDMELSPLEYQTIKSIVKASSYPLSIVLVGVGDGPWEDMKKLEEKLPERKFNNFKFVNFTEIMSEEECFPKEITSEDMASEKETVFAVAALMELSLQYCQYVEAKKRGIIGHMTGKGKKINPLPPPLPTEELSNYSSTTAERKTYGICAICETNKMDMAFNCGHLTCQGCGSKMFNCPFCRKSITNRLKVYI